MSDSFSEEELEQLLRENPEFIEDDTGRIQVDSYLIEICDALTEVGVDLSALEGFAVTSDGLDTAIMSQDTPVDIKNLAHRLYKFSQILYTWDLMGREGSITKETSELFDRQSDDDEAWMAACRKLTKARDLEAISAVDLREKFGEDMAHEIGKALLRKQVTILVEASLRELFGEHDDLIAMASLLGGAIIEQYDNDEDGAAKLIQMAVSYRYNGWGEEEIRRFMEITSRALLEADEDLGDD